MGIDGIIMVILFDVFKILFKVGYIMSEILI